MGALDGQNRISGNDVKFLKAPTLKQLDDFTFEQYSRLLKYLKQIYEIIPFRNAPPGNTPYLILRHDVDWSLNSALRIAQLEQDLGIKSTYFILVFPSCYNVLEEKNTNIIQEISKLGHEIGLHYSPSSYRSMRRNMLAILRQQAQLLERVSGKKVVSIARHGPWDRDPFANIKFFINANHPFMRGDLYVHDSCRAWTSVKGLLELLNNPPRKVQLLTHCENWHSDRLDRETLLKKLLQMSGRATFPIEQRLKKYWFEDPVIIDYDQAVKTVFSPEQCYAANTLPQEFTRNSKNALMNEFEYYKRLVHWHLVNTSIGWRFHQIRSEIRFSKNEHAR